jgi:hypothetical protein
MSFDFGSFAGGVSKTWDSKAIGGAINQGMLNQDVQAAEDKAKEDQAALEHLKKAQAEKGHRVQDDTGEMFTYGASRAVDDDWVKKQQERSANNRTEAIKTAYTKWKSPEAYNAYLKSEAEGSKASFEKFVTDGKMSFAKELRDLRSNKAAMVEKAVEMGQLPKGSVFDPKSGQVLTPGQNGQMVPMPISDADINSFMDSYELQGWRKFGAGVDDFLKGQQAEIALATKGDQIEAAGLKNKETKAKINYLDRRGKAAIIAAGSKGTTGGAAKPRKVKLGDPDENGTQLERDAETQQPTGYSTDARGSRWPNEFPTNQAYQEALAVAKKAGVEIIQNKEGAIAYQAGSKRFNSLSQANAYAMGYAKEVNNNAKQKRAQAIQTEARSPTGRARTKAIQDAALKLVEEEENPYGDYYAE